MDGIASFGPWLKQRRKALLLTQDDLARLVGCAVITIRKIEADELRPSPQITARLAEQLEFEPDELQAFLAFARLAATGVLPALPTAQPATRAAEPFAPVSRRELHSADVGLMALVELMTEHEVREAVAAFRAEFALARQLIDSLADYKQLHDLFQQLEDRYFLIYHDMKSLPGDEGAWERLERNEPDLLAALDTLLALNARIPFTAEATLWKQKLGRVRAEVPLVIEQRDVGRLQSTTLTLKDVIGRELSRANMRLIGTASSLRSERWCKPSHDPRAVRPAARGAGHHRALGNLCHRRHRTGRTRYDADQCHCSPQCLSGTRRRTTRIEAFVERDASELEAAWQDLTLMIEELCCETDADWAHKLRAIGADLQAALANGNAPKVVRFFRSYRSQAIRGFNQVDWELLTLCLYRVAEGRRTTGDHVEVGRMTTYSAEVSMDEMLPTFSSLAALRVAHSELMDHRRDNGQSAAFLADIASFLCQGRMAGALLDGDADRWAAQSLLDYWSNILLRSGGEAVDASLAEFDLMLAPGSSTTPSAPIAVSTPFRNVITIFFLRARRAAGSLDRSPQADTAAGGRGCVGQRQVVAGAGWPDSGAEAGAAPGSAMWCYLPAIVPGPEPLV